MIQQGCIHCVVPAHNIRHATLFGMYFRPGQNEWKLDGIQLKGLHIYLILESTSLISILKANIIIYFGFILIIFSFSMGWWLTVRKCACVWFWDMFDSMKYYFLRLFYVECSAFLFQFGALRIWTTDSLTDQWSNGLNF